MKIDKRQKHDKEKIIERMRTQWTLPDLQEEFGFTSYRAVQKYVERLLDSMDLKETIELRDNFKRIPRGRK